MGRDLTTGESAASERLSQLGAPTFHFQRLSLVPKVALFGRIDFSHQNRLFGDDCMHLLLSFFKCSVVHTQPEWR